MEKDIPALPPARRAPLNGLGGLPLTERGKTENGICRSCVVLEQFPEGLDPEEGLGSISWWEGEAEGR